MKKTDQSRRRKERTKTAHSSSTQNREDVFGRALYDAPLEQSWAIQNLYEDYADFDVDNYLENSEVMLLDEQGDFEDEDFRLPVAPDQISSKESILSWAVSMLSLSPTARALVQEASNKGWNLSLENLNGPDFHLDVPEKKIILDNGEVSEFALAQSNYFSSILIISLIRALRDVWQENRNGAFDEDYTPEAILTLERIRSADLDIISVLVAWELRCEGYGNLWRHILGSDDGDLAMRFSALLEREPCETFTHKALAAAFKQWFMSEERVDNCDHETLNYMDDILAMAEEQNPFGRKNIQKIDVERLSCLPDKTAYLQYDAANIICDPFYAGMNDEINQSHLMHILHDIHVTYVQNVPFRDENLAFRVFPNGMMTPDEHETIH